MLLIPVAGVAASGDDFYQRLYQRGMAHFAAGDYTHAFMELRNAAFGFVEHVDQFETAQSYAIIAAHRLGHDNDARDSLIRIIAAEKIQPHFRSLALPADIRADVDLVAAAQLTIEECTILGVPEQVQQAAAAGKPPVVVPTPTKGPNVAVTAPREKSSADDKAPADVRPRATPQPAAPAPQPRTIAPQPVAPTPQPVVPTPQPGAPTQKSVAPAPQPVVPTPQPMVPAPQPVAPAPQPVVPTTKSVQPVPQPQPPASHPITPPKHETTPLLPKPQKPVPPQPPVKDADATLGEAQRAIEDGDLGRARSIYSVLLSAPSLSHSAALRIAEGLYRLRDYQGAARAFQRAGALVPGEEQYHYYYAVTLYEMGRYAEAKRELAVSLPFISATTEVTRYRAKIEGAIE